MRISLLFFAVAAAWAQTPADSNSRPFYDRTLASFTSERLPSWLKLSGEFRTRVEGRTGFNYQPDNNDGFNIHGAYGSFKRIVPRATLEPYLLWKTGNVSIWTGGLRVAAMPGTPGLLGFDYQAELVKQWGTVGTRAHSAGAAYAIVGYTLIRRLWSLCLSAYLCYASC